MLSQLLRSSSCIILLMHASLAQKSIFDRPEIVALVTSAADQIYSINKDSAYYYTEEVRKLLPDHPIVPMMEAVSVLWYNIPVLQDDVFDRFNDRLFATVKAAKKLPEGHLDAIFFEMSARGLLAEYYADRGAYMKAFNEATHAYSLLKQGFDYVEEYPEFLFTVGLYNYFREAYPERHPIYKPLIWFFKSGDKALGLEQLKRATKETIMIRVEAYVYLSYIFLRYEEDPELSHKYITELYEEFPTNPYVQAKFLESYHADKKYSQLHSEIIVRLKADESAYYRLVGNLYGGVVDEYVAGNLNTAFKQYQDAARISNQLPGYADHYKSLIHFGLGRIYHQEGKKKQAGIEFQTALSYAQTKEVIEEVNRWMNP